MTEVSFGLLELMGMGYLHRNKRHNNRLFSVLELFCIYRIRISNDID